MSVSLVMLAISYSPDNLPRLDRYTRVSNPDGILRTEEVADVDSMLMALERSKGVQGLVIVVKRIEGDDPYEFAIGVGRKWGVGQKNSMGFVMVLATVDRSYQLVTGDGLEKHLPDAVSRRIQNYVEVPLLKEGKWGEAVVKTVKAYKDYLEGDHELNNKLKTAEQEDEEADMMAALFVCALFGFGLALIMLSAWLSRIKERRCPKCKQFALKMQGTPKLIRKLGTRRIYEKTFVCSRCGHVVIRRETQDFSSSAPDIYMPMSSRGGSFGGSGGGGGFSSFGGGSFSGGGSGGRF